jgi:hypothetical protein
MRRSLKLCALVLGATFLLGSTPLDAATPSSNYLNSKRKSFAFKGGPYSILDSFPINQGCDFFGPGGPGTDEIKVKVAMGEGATFRVSISPVNGSLGVPNDFDLCVYYPDGTEAGSSGSSGGFESASIKHRSKFRNKVYTISVLSYLVDEASAYKGTVKVTRFVK